MAKYRINAMYEYDGEIEANSPEEAEKIFLEDLNMYYVSTYSMEIDEVEEEEEDEEE